MSSIKKLAFLCHAKVMHVTPESAQAAADRMNARINPDTVHAFKCAVCEGWHIGTKIKSKIKRAEARVKSQ